MTTTRQSSARRRPPVRGAREPRTTRGRRSPAARARTGTGLTRRKAMRRRWVALLTVLTVAGLVYVLFFTSLLGVRSVEVVGADSVPAERVRDVADVPDRRAMLRVDTDAIAERVATLPGIATVDVSRSWPSTIEIAVTERSPIGFYNDGEELYLVDGGGLVYKKVAQRPKGLPELKLAEVGPDDPATRAATSVLRAIPAQLRERVRVVRAETPGSVEFTLAGGKVVRWGDAEQSERKAKVLAALLTRQGTTYDVSAPELPTVS
ncbi:cell division protein FtsQ/DivIB [Prauserella muralis]|uniref:Cell division protein FtsQ n=1 Tax=Prauserella muralis TaxID=588067 RepID=A0A2V4AI21_9PSEU|nr:FtsQ-type POTRA domain-containing protein [Prauserella muralis]PXY19529.1 cell division protein FtsQ [Prauserella muralis]TWE29516.1 cell division protein FtsQ [Prauserella muralis]